MEGLTNTNARPLFIKLIKQKYSHHLPHMTGQRYVCGLVWQYPHMEEIEPIVLGICTGHDKETFLKTYADYMPDYDEGSDDLLESAFAAL